MDSGLTRTVLIGKMTREKKLQCSRWTCSIVNSSWPGRLTFCVDQFTRGLKHLIQFTPRRVRRCALPLRRKRNEYFTLVDDIEAYLVEDENRDDEFPSMYHKNLMEMEVIQAIEDGKTLKLGCILSDEYSPCNLHQRHLSV